MIQFRCSRIPSSTNIFICCNDRGCSVNPRNLIVSVQLPETGLSAFIRAFSSLSSRADELPCSTKESWRASAVNDSEAPIQASYLVCLFQPRQNLTECGAEIN